MIEIAAEELLASDVGQRAIATRDGNAVEGILDSFWVNRTHKGDVQIQSLVIKTEGAEFKIVGAPLDYLLQVERRCLDRRPHVRD